MPPSQPDVHATNQDFSRFDQVSKEQVYRLAEGTTQQESFDEQFQITSCDLGAFIHGNGGERQAFVQQFGQALEEIGFAILTGHGIETSIYRDTAAKVTAFYEQIPESARLPYRAARHGSVSQGYFPMRATSQIHPDLVEGWVFCRRAFNWDGQSDYRQSDYWPQPGFEPFFRGYVQHHQPLILPIMQSMLTYLGCDPHLYDQTLQDTNFGLRLNYYPPLNTDHLASGAGRILGHEDVDLFTLLAAPEVEGLQVLNRKNGKWVRLNAPPGSLIINTGDYMQRLSNDIFPSTTHRVSVPENPVLHGQPRVSFPIAVYLWEETEMRVLPGLPNPKYPPVKAIHFHTQTTAKFYGEDYAVKPQDKRQKSN